MRLEAEGFTGDDVALGDPGLLVGLITAAEPVWRQVQARLVDVGIPRQRGLGQLIGGDSEFADYHAVCGVSPEFLLAGGLRGLTRADGDRIRSSYAIPPGAPRGIAVALLDRSPFGPPSGGWGLRPPSSSS